MEEGIIEKGRTVEGAVEAALERLGLRRDKVEVEVLEEGSKGILAWGGGRLAMVRVIPKISEAAWAERIIKDILALMRIEAQVRSYERDGLPVVDVSTSGMEGLLIGKDGQTLNALQHLVDRILWKKGIKERKALIDVANYRRRRDRMLAEKARDLAAQVKDSQNEVVTDPLPAADRRVIHLTLKDDPEVRTYTVGEGLLRSVVVAPTKFPAA